MADYAPLIFEKKFWNKNFRFVAGVDEVGRGAFAGPVVAGCVVFAPRVDNKLIKIVKQNKVVVNDSKKLTALQRNKADDWIKNNCLAWGIGIVDVSQINKVGMSKATKSAFRLAIIDANKRLWGTIDYLLIDAFYLPYVKGIRRKNQTAIIKGDQKSFSIAASSIIAKVYRDSLMTRMSKTPKYKKYKWDVNKGYGTEKHLLAIEKYGPTRQHRKLYIENHAKKKAK